MINVTKTFLPPFEEYSNILKPAWEKSWITNNGQLLLELEKKLRTYLDVEYLWYCSNGTVVLQMALKALKISGEVITTPFSYVATTSAILWENCTPVFVDINTLNFCIDSDKIEAAITSKSEAILATHVFGYPCEVAKLEKIALKYGLKVIYDGAHAFGTTIGGKSILSFGDISTCSFHATKVFHTVEGGCIIPRNEMLANELFKIRNFGHIGDEHFTVGINGKNSELHAAMGLSNLKYIDSILNSRKKQWLFYQSFLKMTSGIELLQLGSDVEYNYAYFPVVFETEKILERIIFKLNKSDIFPRRYFHPSLNTLPYINYVECPISESIASRILCLPLFFDLEEKVQVNIIDIILKEINNS